jgi:hypothetical protein
MIYVGSSFAAVVAVFMLVLTIMALFATSLLSLIPGTGALGFTAWLTAYWPLLLIVLITFALSTVALLMVMNIKNFWFNHDEFGEMWGSDIFDPDYGKEDTTEGTEEPTDNTETTDGSDVEVW